MKPNPFQVHGSGEPTLVLVHGWAMDRHVWDGDVPRLAARHRVVTLDLPGHGAGDRRRAEWTIVAFARGVKAVVDAVDPKQVVLVGHSMGGSIVVEAARLMPRRLRGIVLVDTLLDVEQRSSQEEIDPMLQALEADYKTTVTRMSTEYLFTQQTPAGVRECVLRQATALPADISIALLRESWTHDPLPALRKIEAPIRAVNADKFPTNLAVNRRHMPGYDAIIVKGCGHYPMLEDPAQFGPALDRALAQVLAAR